jgi:hypothetical protein
MHRALLLALLFLSACFSAEAGSFYDRGPRPYELLLALGITNGDTTIHVKGRNADISTTEEDVWGAGGKRTWLTVGAPIRIAAGGNAADTAAGAGAREVTVTCLDDSLVEWSETLATAGAAASAFTSASCFRLQPGTYVSASGTYAGSNVGDILLETAAVDVGQIDAGHGVASGGAFTVPAGEVAYLRLFGAAVDGNKQANTFLWYNTDATDIAAPFSAPQVEQMIPGLQGSQQSHHDTWEGFAAGTDLWTSAATLVGNAGVYTELEIVLVAD